jgi:DNA end-binding protein Ku
MPRPIWSGALAFGLVTIPVQLHTAVRDHRPRFRLLHRKDESPVHYERVCQREGKTVAWEDLVKGYEYEKGRFVTLTKEDFRAAALEKSRTVQILDFVDPEDVDERYFETPYYLTPGKGGDHAYALLREAIRSAGRIGIAKMVLRETQHLAALDAIGEALVLTTMRFADELVDVSDLKFPPAKGLPAKELELAGSLIGSFVADWEPGKYTDDYRENLVRIIRAKLKGRKARLTEDEDLQPQEARVVDLMSRLRESLASAEKRARGRSAAGIRKPVKGKKTRRAA